MVAEDEWALKQFDDFESEEEEGREGCRCLCWLLEPKPEKETERPGQEQKEQTVVVVAAAVAASSLRRRTFCG